MACSITLVNLYSLGAYQAPGTMLGDRDALVNKTSMSFQGIYILRRETDRKWTFLMDSDESMERVTMGYVMA